MLLMNFASSCSIRTRERQTEIILSFSLGFSRSSLLVKEIIEDKQKVMET
jgi:hypothetical protein